MDVRAIDLNLLVVFAAMAEHRSVTRAGEAIGLSQPAMSAALARLRALFNDALFVRSGAEMKPTPRALELARAGAAASSRPCAPTSCSARSSTPRPPSARSR